MTKDTLLSLSHQQALDFFLEHENYFDVSLPIYFNISKLLKNINIIDIKNPNLLFNKIKNKDKTHLILYTHKSNGTKRPLTMVNPVLHVLLAKKLTQENTWQDFIRLFDFYEKQDNIKCHSLPIISRYRKFAYYKARQIMNWYDNFEQASVKLSLIYNYMAASDIQNFYPSITNHSLTTSLAQSKSKNLMDFADLCEKFLNTCQEKGLPQGNNLFHLLADTVLLNADKILHGKIKKHHIKDYQILRYRDDYRIFTNDKSQADIILALLKETLYSLGLAHNEQKTGVYDDIIYHAIKHDKHAWLDNDILLKNDAKTTATHKILLIIKEYGRNYPNTSGVQRGLQIVYQKLKQDLDFVDKEHLTQIIAITLDIAKSNPRWTANCLQIIDCLSVYINENQYEKLAKIVHKKLIHNNTDCSVILWVQRFIYSLDNTLFDLTFNNLLDQYINHQNNHDLWNFSFVKNKSMKEILNTPIMDFDLIDNKEQILSDKEVNLFFKSAKKE